MWAGIRGYAYHNWPLFSSIFFVISTDFPSSHCYFPLISDDVTNVSDVGGVHWLGHVAGSAFVI